MKYKQLRLGDLAEFTTGKLNANKAVEDGKYPFFTTSPETLRINNFAFDQDAILLGGNNANGVFQLKRYTGKFNAYQRTYVISVVKENIINNDYLYYALMPKLVELQNKSLGTATKFITKRILENLLIKVPNNYNEMERRATYLRTIDNKIQLNKQLNDNLDEIKAAYFDKSFNQQMQSNLNGKLKNITKITSGKRPNKKSDTKSSKDKYPIVGASKVMGYTDNYLYNEPILTTGRVGTHGIIQRFREPVWVSDNSFVFKTDHEDYLFEILNHWINYSALNRGSTQPLITQTDLKNIDIYVPTESELKKFERVSRILTNLQFSLIKQNRRLDQIKKTLLNKLLL